MKMKKAKPPSPGRLKRARVSRCKPKSYAVLPQTRAIVVGSDVVQLYEDDRCWTKKKSDLVNRKKRKVIRNPAVYTILSLFKDILIYHRARVTQNQLCSHETLLLPLYTMAVGVSMNSNTRYLECAHKTIGPSHMQIITGSTQARQWSNACY